MVESGSRPEQASGLRIDAVEVLPTDLRSVLLRVAGAWEGPRPPDLEAPVLVLHEGAREHRVAALPETSGAASRAAPEPQAFRAAFSVPDPLAPLLEDGTAELDLGPVTVRLPPPAPPGEEAEAGEPEGTVVDPAVLAERRARRAEQAEQANAQRAGDAERTAAKLEGELGKLELRLAAATEERAGLEERLADREREVPAAPRGDLAVLRREAALALALRSARAAPPPPAAPGPVLAAALEAERRLLARMDGLEVAQRAIADARTIIAEARRVVRELADTAAAEASRRRSEAERTPARAERRRTSAEPPALWLEDALRRLARMDAAAGAQLALQLLPGQALALERALDYDVVVAGLGWHRVTVGPGTGELAAAASRRPWWRTDFRVMATPAGIVKLAVEGGAARPAGVRVGGTLRRRRALRRLPAVPLHPGALARAGVLLDPGLLYRGLAAGIDPAWTRGHRFIVALEVSGPHGGSWHVTAADGARVGVAPEAPEIEPDAALRTSQAGFQHLLDGESPPAGEKLAIRGDATAIGLLAQWTDRARGRAGRPRNVRR